MNNLGTEKMLLAIQQTKESAKKAEDEFDAKSREIERKSNDSIDIFGGNATSQVVDLASDARRICDELYATYQTLIVMLDKFCRPLLDENPSAEAVNEVKKMIKWLNDESEIENNYTASLNNASLGNVYSAKYVPSIENKIIQKFWEQTFSLMPGAKEIIAKEEEERRKKEEAEKRARQAVAEAKRAAEHLTTLKADDRQSDSSDCYDERTAEIENLEKDIMLKASHYKEELSETSKAHNNKIRNINRELAHLAQERKAAGVLGMKKKKAIDEQVVKLNNEIKSVKNALNERVTELRTKVQCEEEKLDKIKGYKAMLKPNRGDIVLFGTDPLTKDNKKISWIIVNVTSDQVALFSKDIIGYGVFKSGWKKKQDYVDWLKEFEKTAFSNIEKNGLIKSPLEYYDCPNYAFVFTKEDAKSFSDDWLASQATKELLQYIENDQKLDDFEKAGNRNTVKSSYWLHSRDMWKELRVNRVSNRSGKWSIGTLDSVTNDEFTAGIRPAVLVSRAHLSKQVPDKIEL